MKAAAQGRREHISPSLSHIKAQSIHNPPTLTVEEVERQINAGKSHLQQELRLQKSQLELYEEQEKQEKALFFR